MITVELNWELFVAILTNYSLQWLRYPSGSDSYAYRINFLRLIHDCLLFSLFLILVMHHFFSNSLFYSDMHNIVISGGVIQGYDSWMVVVVGFIINFVVELLNGTCETRRMFWVGYLGWACWRTFVENMGIGLLDACCRLGDMKRKNSSLVIIDVGQCWEGWCRKEWLWTKKINKISFGWMNRRKNYPSQPMEDTHLSIW